MQISLRKWVRVTVVCAGVSPVGRRLFAVELHMAISPFKLVKKKTFNFSCTARQEARRLFRATPRRPGAPHTHGHGPPAAGNAVTHNFGNKGVRNSGMLSRSDHRALGRSRALRSRLRPERSESPIQMWKTTLRPWLHATAP